MRFPAKKAFKAGGKQFYTLYDLDGIYEIASTHLLYWDAEARINGRSYRMTRRRDIERVVSNMMEKTMISPYDCIICDICGEPSASVIERSTDVVCRKCHE